MRRTIHGLALLAVCLSVGVITGSPASGQQRPRDDGPPPPRAERDDDRPPPPPPAKAGPPRPRDGDGPPRPREGDGPQGRGEFGGRGRGGYGGRGGVFGGGYGGPPPGADPFGASPIDDPEMRELLKQDFDLDRQAHDMALRVRNSRGEERSKLKIELTELVNKHFDVRQKRRELQLKRMEEELKRLRDAIGERNESRSTIVGNRLQELIGESRNLDF